MSLVPVQPSVVVLTMSGRRTAHPSWWREAGGSADVGEDRQQAVTALTDLIQVWWSSGQGHSADAVRGSDQSGGAAAGDQSASWSG
jgi:hypothetical protein